MKQIKCYLISSIYPYDNVLHYMVCHVLKKSPEFYEKEIDGCSVQENLFSNFISFCHIALI